MSFKAGKFEISVSFLVALFLLVVVAYLLFWGGLSPMEIYKISVQWINKH